MTILGCSTGVAGDDCSSESDCTSGFACVQCTGKNTCYNSERLDDESAYRYACATYGSGTPTSSSSSGASSSSSSSSGGSSSRGACAFFDTRLKRMLCEQRSGASSCSGKFFGGGTTCAGLSCSAERDPSSCTIPGASSSSSSSSGGSSNCSNAWKGPTDGQATPMCLAACNHGGKSTSAGEQTCQVLASMLEKPSSIGSVCPACSGCTSNGC